MRCIHGRAPTGPLHWDLAFEGATIPEKCEAYSETCDGFRGVIELCWTNCSPYSSKNARISIHVKDKYRFAMKIRFVSEDL
ncbi:uncharacterized protein PHALS_05933 [Plasmopara halstedii]|uniref:Uncharacterized protein n=1 Tax=Plasmopara halstedii TaxID=4781 RepID=A0A0P1AAX9_PLAHL|nr:uncharacterized protein PHALS_05933 [Plasmopara halstedii]CEG37884.1 hypothetical protein PHALS_05933 [Plasmopara halstedii]|eukprot:XP_024574253.1 hypothetical protein PHALS_05933 [Plasmopara halstedii]